MAEESRQHGLAPLPHELVYLAAATVVRREDYERHKSELEQVAREAVGAAVADYLWRQGEEEDAT